MQNTNKHLTFNRVMTENGLAHLILQNIATASKFVFSVAGLTALPATNIAEASEPEVITRTECLAKDAKSDKLDCLMRLKIQRQSELAAAEQAATLAENRADQLEAENAEKRAAVAGLTKVLEMQEGPERE